MVSSKVPVWISGVLFSLITTYECLSVSPSSSMYWLFSKIILRRRNRADKSLHSYDGKFASSARHYWYYWLSSCAPGMWSLTLILTTFSRFVRVDIEKLSRKPLWRLPRSEYVHHEWGKTKTLYLFSIWKRSINIIF